MKVLLNLFQLHQSGYRPGKRDFPDSPTPERDTNSPALEHPIFDMLDVFATEVTGALTTTPKHVSGMVFEDFWFAFSYVFHFLLQSSRDVVKLCLI